MTTPAVSFPADDRECYPLHEEDDVPEIDFHRVQTTDLHDALRARFPERFVGANICIYWVPNNTHLYRAPDVFVAEGMTEEPHPRVYLTWLEPAILLAIEIGSRSTFREDEGPKQQIYERHIRAREYLYSNPPVGDLRLWRSGPHGYELVPVQPNGRVQSAAVSLEFGIEEGYLRAYTPEGERLRTHLESESLLAQEVQRREEIERQLAEARAQLARRGRRNRRDRGE
jgi:hypothetical protein